MKSSQRAALLALLFTACLQRMPQAAATEAPQEVPVQAEIIEHLGQPVDKNLAFIDERGQELRLADLLDKGRPVVVVPVYFRCPRLCDLTQRGLIETIKGVGLELGRDFYVVSLSFNPDETPEQALTAAKNYRSSVENAGDPQGWKFLTGNAETIGRALKQLGFPVSPDRGEFIHSAALMVLAPDGMISRYFYGIKYEPEQLRFALVEAAQGKIGNTLDRLYMYCFRFDSTKGKYSLAIWNVTRVFCSAFFIVVVVSLIVLKMRE